MEHTLHATGGCYNWISKGSDVATVSQGDGCTTNATITSVWWESAETEASTRIDALSTTAATGGNSKASTISCDVIVRHINAIKVVSRYHLHRTVPSTSTTIYKDHHQALR